MKIFFLLFHLILTFTFSHPTIASAGEVYLYHHENITDELDLGTIRKIFRAGKLSWKNGENIVILLNELGQIADSSFVEFSGINKAQFMDQWRVKFFSGRALVPIQVKDSRKALESIAENPSGIYFSFRPLETETENLKNVKSKKMSF